MVPPPPTTPGSLLDTPGFSHYAVAWSPFHNNRLALASAANYGLVGNGRLHIASLIGPTVQLDKFYSTQDGLYDIAWSEVHENQIVTASGDGSIKLWDILLNVSSLIKHCLLYLLCIGAEWTIGRARTRIYPLEPGMNIPVKCFRSIGPILTRTSSSLLLGTEQSNWCVSYYMSYLPSLLQRYLPCYLFYQFSGILSECIPFKHCKPILLVFTRHYSHPINHQY